MLAYFDCFAGIAGDMTIAALMDLGLDMEYLESRVRAVLPSGYSLESRRSTRRGISGMRFLVNVHDGQPSRSYADIRGAIESAEIEHEPRDTALRILETIAQAESRVHGVPLDEVHFHEIGAIDSIVDIVGTAVGIYSLGIDKIISSPLPLSRGFVHTAHGPIPTPAPATTEILTGVPVTASTAPLELVTPTGAAIIKTLASDFGGYPSFVPTAVGYGLGSSDPEEFPNALRISLGKDWQTCLRGERVSVIECQIDDLDPRVIGQLMDAILQAGALDVTFTPVQMKKNRPGTLITLLAPPHLVSDLARLMLTHTTTIGLRVHNAERVVLPRRSELVDTSLGQVRVKVVERPSGRVERRVEFDDACLLAERERMPVRDVLTLLERELASSETTPSAQPKAPRSD